MNVLHWLRRKLGIGVTVRFYFDETGKSQKVILDRRDKIKKVIAYLPHCMRCGDHGYSMVEGVRTLCSCGSMTQEEMDAIPVIRFNNDSSPDYAPDSATVPALVVGLVALIGAMIRKARREATP